MLVPNWSLLTHYLTIKCNFLLEHCNQVYAFFFLFFFNWLYIICCKWFQPAISSSIFFIITYNKCSVVYHGRVIFSSQGLWRLLQREIKLLSQCTKPIPSQSMTFWSPTPRVPATRVYSGRSHTRTFLLRKAHKINSCSKTTAIQKKPGRLKKWNSHLKYKT